MVKKIKIFQQIFNSAFKTNFSHTLKVKEDTVFHVTRIASYPSQNDTGPFTRKVAYLK